MADFDDDVSENSDGIQGTNLYGNLSLTNDYLDDIDDYEADFSSIYFNISNVNKGNQHDENIKQLYESNVQDINKINDFDVHFRILNLYDVCKD